jgi:DUF3053 family protein
MIAFNRRFAGLVALALFTCSMTLAACGDNEPERRKAFIEFLQTRIIDRPGLHIPILSDKNLADFGDYARHYNILNGFHHQLNATVQKDMARAMQIGSPKSLEQLRDQRALIPVLTAGMKRLRDELDKAEADASVAHKALQQPPDLKAVYDRAYERMVAIPAKVFRELMPIIESMLPKLDAFASYLDDNRNVIDIRGNQTTIKTEAARARFAVLADQATKAAEAAEEGKRKLQRMATGN